MPHSESRANENSGALGDSPDPAEIEALAAALGSKHGRDRHEARLRLVAIGRPATARLIEALADRNSNVRWEAAKALGQIGDPAAIPALVKALEDDNFGVRWLAAEGLIHMKEEALVPLLRALATRPDSRWLREAAHHVLRTLGTLGLHDRVAAVLAAMDDVEPAVEVPLAARAALDALEEAGRGTPQESR
jgi:HEAT repeat protein